ncbi:MAG: histidinol-phosphate transaminase [Caulobacterales bacterium]
MPPRPLPTLAAIEPYKAGEAVLPGFDKPIKLASNENPLGASPKAQAAYAQAAATLNLYPDPSSAGLRRAIADRYGLDPERIICGAGSDEIFQLLGRAYLTAGDEIVQSEFAFLVYRLVAQQSGATVKTAKDIDFVVDVDAMLALVGPKTRIVFLANPNNPTGTYLPIEAVRRLHAGLPENVLLVLDGAYAEYVRRNDYAAGVELVSEFDNVVMTRTFSKIHGLAGARVGWAYAPAHVIDALHKVRGPFNVAAAAQAAAIAAIGDSDFMARAGETNAAELARVASELSALGLRVTPSVCNFLLVHFDGEAKARAVDAHLRSRGLIVRAVAGYGLPAALRISIGMAAENAALIAAMREFFAS